MHQVSDPQRELKYLTANRVMVVYELPLNEIVLDFYDRLKTLSRGYASLDYEHLDYRASDLVRLNILINGERVDALSQLVHRDNAVARARTACEKLRDEIPRQMFKIAIQGAIGGNIISRSTVSAFRKDVTAKLYGGDITRKMKVLKKQKEGKRRMKSIGQVQIELVPYDDRPDGRWKYHRPAELEGLAWSPQRSVALIPAQESASAPAARSPRSTSTGCRASVS